MTNNYLKNCFIVRKHILLCLKGKKIIFPGDFKKKYTSKKYKQNRNQSLIDKRVLEHHNTVKQNQCNLGTIKLTIHNNIWSIKTGRYKVHCTSLNAFLKRCFQSKNGKLMTVDIVLLTSLSDVPHKPHDLHSIHCQR